ncbi:MAG: FHA domain-containing protein [Anaerolineae bacterium]|nr:FHA domain-containing protein [Anaerolineae bacterium]
MNDQSDSKHGKTAPLDLSRILPYLNNNETAIVPGGANRIKRQLEEAAQEEDEALVHDPSSVMLRVRGITESVRFGPERATVVVGRVDLGSLPHPDIDLVPLGGIERGVSRRHARLELVSDHLYLTDLNSANGTFVNGNRLDSYTPTLLHNGDEVMLGRLAVSIVFV